MANQKSAADMLSDANFKKLCREKDVISFVLTILQFILYFGFISLIAFNKPLVGEKISGSMTLGIPLAVGTIFFSWVLTGIYIYWANTKYDHLVKEVKERIGH